MEDGHGPGDDRVDAAVVGRLVADIGPEAVDELCRVFAAEARERLPAISAACRSLDAGRAAAAAHRLKSACGFLGVASLAWRCREIERLARAGQVEGAGRLADLAAAELDIVVDDLAGVVRALAPKAATGPGAVTFPLP